MQMKVFCRVHTESRMIFPFDRFIREVVHLFIFVFPKRKLENCTVEMFYFYLKFIDSNLKACFICFVVYVTGELRFWNGNFTGG